MNACGAASRWGALAALLALGTSGCADHYLISNGTMANVTRLPDEVREHVAVPGYRERDRRPVWVRAGAVETDSEAPSPLPGHVRVRETNGTDRISKAGVATLAVGVVGLALAAVFSSTGNSCSAPGALPCIPGSGDWATPLALGGGLLFFGGTGVSLARAVDLHPAEATTNDDDLVFMGVPVEHGTSRPAPQPSTPPATPSSTKTSIE